MKRIINILLFAVLAISCMHKIEPEITNLDTNKVKLSFSIDLPDATPATKAMANQPQLQTLHLAVFDEAGYLTEYIQARELQPATVNGTRYNYTADISLSKTERIIHFIGNGPSQVKFGDEATVMANIKASGNQDMYWYRKVVPEISGINAGGMMALAAGDATGSVYQPTTQTLAYFTEIPLIRNFAKIVLKDEAANFTLISYAVVNTYKEGMVTAYNRNTTEFVDYFNYKTGSVTINYDDPTPDEVINNITVVDVPKTYQQLTQAGYDGNIPAITSFTSPSEAWSNKVNSGAPYFVYERETPISSPSYIIAYGTYQGKDQYYKIDLRDNNGKYFPLLRNFEYTITLKNVERSGYESIEEAANSTGSGDISTALETISLVYISDGKASLEVEYTEKTIVSDDPVDLNFTFLDDVLTNNLGPATDMYIIVNNDFGASGPAIQKIDGNVVTTGARITLTHINPTKIVVTPTTPSNTPKVQTLTIYANYKEDKNDPNSKTKIIQRTVKYVVMTKRTMTAVCVPSEVPEIKGSEFELHVTIPGGLSSSMFPLELAIEAVSLSITPNNERDHMPVKTGKSLLGNGKSAFYFIKTVEWEEYDPLQPSSTIVCHFKTNKDLSATNIVVANPYFENATTSLGNYDAKNFTNLKFTSTTGTTINEIECGEDNPFQFRFTMPELLNGNLPEIENSQYPTDNVLVILEGAEPSADNESLHFIGINTEGKPMYSYRVVNAQENILDLQTNTHGSQVVVTLKSHHYLTSVSTCNRDWVEFTNISLQKAKVGIGNTTTLSFRYNSNVKGVPITMTLKGLKPQNVANNELIENSDGTYTWIYEPTGSNQNQQTHTITFETTTFGTSISVNLEAEKSGYKQVLVSNTRSLVLPKGTLVTCDDLNNAVTANITFHLTNPGTGNSTSISTVRAENGKITNDTEIATGEFAENNTRWFRFYTGGGWFEPTTYYIASATVLDISNGEELKFNEVDE